MYNPSHFKEKNRQTLLAFLEENPFAFLTGSFASGVLVATQIPVLTEERDGELYIQGHMMRQTDHHKALLENAHALAVFTGPSCYVSALWYSNPHGGSTWNYMSVHVRGKIRFMANEELIGLMRRLTLKFEGGNTASHTVYDNLPDSYVNSMMPAIVGFELKAEQLENVFKLSQNKDEASYLNIIAKLEAQGGSAAKIAEEMQKRKAAIFAQTRK
ncbi:MAG: FMN-binding negative transcriptional regulator [Bacteroidetes bacterium]|nr:MAG: FMN-binding negative transcriptional regulator [Bacteroidota bacterium]